MSWLSPRSVVPAPYVLTPSWRWDGDAGSWSTFSIAVGTPPQAFRVLPSTSTSEVWIPVPEACEGILSGVFNCGDLRGVNDFEDTISRGFRTNASSTWSTTGIYQLVLDEPLFNTSDNALYGRDTVTLDNAAGSNDSNIVSQTVAGIASASFWLGSLGLGISPANFSTASQSNPSLLSALRDSALIPSLSFGYAAGAYYANQTPGSLVLGGYDSSRFTPSNVSFPLGGAHNLSLRLAVSNILGMDTLSGTRALLEVTEPVTFTIDSSVADLWLPRASCELFEDAFGLTYDTATDLYLVNDTMHNQLLSRDPSVTFTVGGTNSSTSVTNVVMPYSAFSLNASIPLYNSSTRYFPLRASTNSSQYVLGRTFLQEAYLFVDWETQSFTVGQAIHQNASTEIVPVLSPDSNPKDTGQSGLSSGAIAGIVVACIVGIVGAALVVLILLRRRRRRGGDRGAHNTKVDEKPAELDSSTVPLAEPMSSPIYELQEGPLKHELMAAPIMELQGDCIKQHELKGTEAKAKVKKDSSERNQQHSVHELP